MGIITPRRLARTIPHGTAGMFTVQTASNNAPMTDDTITEISINRGGATVLAGVTPTTCTATVKGHETAMRSGQQLIVSMTREAADLVAAQSSATRDLAPRFAGTIAEQRTVDTGRPDRLFLTSYMGAGNLSYLGESVTKLAPAAGDNIGYSLVTKLLYPADVAPMMTKPAMKYATTGDHYGYFDVAPEPAKATDLVSKYTTDLGIVVRERRDGVPEVIPLESLPAWTSYADTPLARGHVLRSATWHNTARNYSWHAEAIYSQGGGYYGQVVGGTIYQGYVITHPTDLKYARFLSATQPQALVNHLTALKAEKLYRLDAIEVDLLALWRAGEYGRLTVGRLLGLEVYDWTALGADWPAPVQGYYLVTGITETITGRSWRLKLSITPYQLVTGKASPTPAARTWDQVTGTWDQQTTTWDGA